MWGDPVHLHTLHILKATTGSCKSYQIILGESVQKDTIEAHEQILNNQLCFDLILSLFDQFINRYFHSVSFDLRKLNLSNV